MKNVLAIDQSTSATKALLFNEQGKLLDQVSLEHRQVYPRPGWVEHDAEEIYQNVLAAARTLLDRNPAARSDLLCLSITNQRETVLVFGKDSGRPLYHAIVWQCRRGAPICEELVAAGHQNLVRERTGLEVDTYFSASKLRWLVENEPEIGGMLRDGRALAGTIDTYLIYRLTGGKVFATDHTNASRTLLFDIGRLCWDEELCALFQVPMRSLPEVRESSAIFGETTLDGLLDHPLPICGVMGDSQAALFAQRCFTPGTAKVTFGTGSSVLLNTGSTLRPTEGGIVSTIAWVIHGQPTYAFEGIINYSAATIAWLKNQLHLIESASETSALAESVPDNGGVYFVPAFVGLSAPYWQPNARAAIVGLTPDSTREHVVRAALESIAYQVKDVLDLMVSNAGTPLRVIAGDGGAVRNRFLMQFVADIIQYPVRIADIAELSASGAAFSGLMGMGHVSRLSQLSDLPVHYQEYQPGLAKDRVTALYAGWQDAVRRVL